MSYINEALRKAQKEKESRYAAYSHLITPVARKGEKPPVKILSAVLLAVLLVITIIVFAIYSSESRITPAEMQAVAPKGAAEQALQEALALMIFAPDADQAGDSRGITATATPKKEPTNTAALYQRALAMQKEGKTNEAKELYKTIIKTDPRHVQALNNLGVIYLSQKNYKWAIIRFNDALAVKPNYADVHYNLACLYTQKMEAAKGVHYLKKAIELNPAARQWAKKDNDLKALRGFPEYNNLMNEQDN